MLKNEKIKTRRIKFQQAPDGTLVKTEDDKVLEHFFYNKQGLLAQSSKYNYTRDGKLQTPVNTIYIYDAQLRLLSDSTDRVKSCYYYNNGSELMSYSTQYSYKTNVPYRIDSVAYTYNQQNKLATIVTLFAKKTKRKQKNNTHIIPKEIVLPLLISRIVMEKQKLKNNDKRFSIIMQTSY